ncbi:hypothetical protein SAMN06265338_101746 [Rhodoblastus acidophilus]|uniref:Uncharacterized protein n=1 Tax=Rhodoblastus acidophilus TaxID=1074 RepID=A0A212QLE5_RHOAC|nr:hypothetical protein [Rhodoblastus acidophilus]PPQ39855.1 hypothetical protein CKO16_03355 [Rhodoblastus acidophilus]RAI23831.1 hypothetical protein CH337_02965 [Rhodoblastus acidophilus]SNB60175.1 hypothetical protein SAMN06265338_101746 [Rhodoblastus acidophilus]
MNCVRHEICRRILLPLREKVARADRRETDEGGGAAIRLAQLGLPPLRGPRDAEMLKIGATFLAKGVSLWLILQEAGIEGANVPLFKADWDESLHPRDPKGRFATTGASADQNGSENANKPDHRGPWSAAVDAASEWLQAPVPEYDQDTGEQVGTRPRWRAIVTSPIVVGAAGAAALLGGEALLAPAAAEAAVPYGFANAREFSQFGSALHDALTEAGYADAQGIMQGSAVTGMSYRAGAAFDAGRLSDFDIALAGDKLFQVAQDAGIALRSAGTRTGPLDEAALEKLGLSNVSMQLSQQAGRPVNFMIYNSTSTAISRAPSIVVPR